jgi:hypothetical protein
MKYVYVLVYSYDYKSIADPIFFTTAEEAIQWKKDMIDKGQCGNPITAYDVKRLESL